MHREKRRGVYSFPFKGKAGMGMGHSAVTFVT